MTWTAEQDADFRAAVDAGEVMNGHNPAPAENLPPVLASTWSAIDLAPILAGIQAGDIVGPVPALMARTDGAMLLYPGEVHSLAGEPESGKGWITLACSAAVVASGEHVLYIDFEDAPASIITRLLALQAAPADILERFTYVRPCDPFGIEAFTTLLTTREYALGIIDGLSEAYGLLGLDPYSNPDAAKFLTALPRPIAQRGAAVILIDHVVKSKETRGRYALGAQHKLAGIAVAYGTDVIRPPSRTDTGLIKLKVEKDRHGHVRGHAVAGEIALVHIAPEDNGQRVTVTLEPPNTIISPTTGSIRPTFLMERVSMLLERQPGAGLNEIRNGIKGKTKFVDDALRLLIDEGYVGVEPNGQKRCHYSSRPYREDDDRDPATQPRPATTQDAEATNRDPATPPLKGSRVTGRGHHDTDPEENNRDPNPDAEPKRLQATPSDTEGDPS